jgi:hypothetical protein
MAEVPPPVQIQIQIDDATANGVYVNLAMVNHSRSTRRSSARST